MKRLYVSALISVFVSIVFFGGCSSKSALNTPLNPGQDNESIIPDNQNANREIYGAYSVEINPLIPEVKLEPIERVGSYHFNLTNLRPNVLTTTSYGFDPNHGNDFYIDLRLSHPYPGSGIDGFDPRVIAVLPADSPLSSLNFPLLQVTTNNRVVMEPDGYTKLYDKFNLPGNTNPFRTYFKDQPYHRWSSTGATQETLRWYIDLGGFQHGIAFYLICDVCTGFPNPPTPVTDNAPEPMSAEVVISDGMYANGGYADVEVTILDWQGPEKVALQVESPSLFDSIIDLDYIGGGTDPDTYKYAGEIGNYKSSPAGEYYCLISAFDGFSAMGTYFITKAHVDEFVEPVIHDAYYDFSIIDIKEIHLVGDGFGNEQGSSVVYIDGETSGFTVSSWRFDEMVIQIPNDNLDHTVQLEIDGVMTDLINLPESSTILLVYNTNRTDSVSIKDYYASPVTGRDIKPEKILGLSLSLNEGINRTQFNNEIKTPIENYILDNDLKYKIKYIVLAKGIPLKIAATGGSDYTDLDYAAIESELTLLFTGDYNLPGRILSPFYGKKAGEYFHPFKYRRGNIIMAYLVTRLAAWTLDDVYGEIERGKNGYSGSAAYAILDGDPGKWYDRMEAAEIVYQNIGINYLFDNTNVFLTAATIGNPTISDNVIAYTGHGIHHSDYPPGGDLYIFELDFGLLNGSIFNTYESSNGTSYEEGNRSGMGMVGDWIQIGGTGGIGHVYEPWSDAVGDERYLYPAQVAGNNLAEACYLACKYVSWVETIAGDPLCIIDVK